MSVWHSAFDPIGLLHDVNGHELQRFVIDELRPFILKNRLVARKAIDRLAKALRKKVRRAIKRLRAGEDDFVDEDGSFLPISRELTNDECWERLVAIHDISIVEPQRIGPTNDPGFAVMLDNAKQVTDGDVCYLTRLQKRLNATMAPVAVKSVKPKTRKRRRRLPRRVRHENVKRKLKRRDRRKTPTANSARDKWIYKQVCNTKITLQKTLGNLRRKIDSQPIGRKWSLISSIQGLRRAAINYAKRYEKPPPPSRQEK